MTTKLERKKSLPIWKKEGVLQVSEAMAEKLAKGEEIEFEGIVATITGFGESFKNNRFLNRYVYTDKYNPENETVQCSKCGKTVNKKDSVKYIGTEQSGRKTGMGVGVSYNYKSTNSRICKSCSDQLYKEVYG